MKHYIYIYVYICINNNKQQLKNNIMNLEFKKVASGKYKVIKSDNVLGYIEKWDNNPGWVFYQDEDGEWFGGYETLKKAKTWLTSFNAGDYIINKIIK